MLERRIKRDNAVDAGNMQNLPELEQGINLLNAGYSSTAFHVLVARYLHKNQGEVLWGDSANNSNAYVFTDRLTPRRELHKRIKVARAFTVHKHLGLIQQISGEITENTGLIALPAFLHLYRNTDEHDSEAHHLLDLAIEKINSIIREQEVKVLISSPVYGSMGRKLVRITDKGIDLEKTPEGTVFRTEGFETQRFGDQTNLLYWEDIGDQKEKPVIEEVLA